MSSKNKRRSSESSSESDSEATAKKKVFNKKQKHDSDDSNSEREENRKTKRPRDGENRYKNTNSNHGHRSRDDYRDRKDDRKRDERSHSRERENVGRNFSRNRDDRYKNDRRSPYRNRNDRRNRRRSRSKSYDHANALWGKNNDKKKEEKPPVDKQKPNFGLSGKLTEETNTYKGIVIKYSEPPEARKPKRRWRLYPFKGEKALQTLYIHRESAYLIGRERKVVDLPVDHPSCSKQHAALQYRLVPFTREDGTSGKRVRPYLIDLESANGTYINNKRIEPKKYVELLEKDVIKFGFSSREYVLLHENSKDEAQDDDVKEEDAVKEEVTVKEEKE